jgi:hypothetical protein
MPKQEKQSTSVSVRLDADVLSILSKLRRLTGKTGDRLLNQCVRLNAGALLVKGGAR